MEGILKLELREKAGSDSYNRYEYQVHWICYHIIQCIKEGKDFLLFCEFHDDMAAQLETEKGKLLEFYQVKTNQNITHKWSISKLTDKQKRENGTFKNSFLGFIFYNFHKFSAECSSCHFVSNIGLDSDLQTWQEIIKNGELLKQKDQPLYKKIREKLIKEYKNLSEKEFNKVFDKFIQNTYISKSDLTLEQYEILVKGEFYDAINHLDLDIGNSYRLLNDILNLIRKKTKTTIKIPISYENLVAEKGISSDVFINLRDKFTSLPKIKNYHADLKQFINDYTKDLFLTTSVMARLRNHEESKLDVNNSLYMKLINDFEEKCNYLVKEHMDELGDHETAYFLIEREIAKVIASDHELIDDKLLRGVFYERIFKELIQLQKAN